MPPPRSLLPLPQSPSPSDHPTWTSFNFLKKTIRLSWPLHAVTGHVCGDVKVKQSLKYSIKSSQNYICNICTIKYKWRNPYLYDLLRPIQVQYNTLHEFFCFSRIPALSSPIFVTLWNRRFDNHDSHIGISQVPRCKKNPSLSSFLKLLSHNHLGGCSWSY